ncbi:MAG: type II toxin-antitoxin system VapC family toxin [Desulfococcaceae bacterium]
MKPVFVDTSALIALGNKEDIFYHQACRIRLELVRTKRKFATTNLVIAELCNAFSNIRFRSIAISTVESIQQSVMWNYIVSDRKLMDEGFALYKKMKDKSWGMVDCVSIVTAEKFGCNEIFTTDHHFEQAGFRILLKNQNRLQCE